MTRIAKTFARLRAEEKQGLIPFITAGDPDINTTCDLLVELARAGASVIELGVPFTDPIADGPVIQRASMRALENGIDVAKTLEIVREVRQDVDVPVVLFSYFNLLLQFGIERLSSEARRAGVDGVLVTDLPPEESGDFALTFAKNEVDNILLVAPTSTDERLRMIAQRATGFIYAVSRTGITGPQTDMSTEAESLVARVRAVTDLPIAVGFGISTCAQVRDVWRYADAAVVGSALVAEIERLADSSDLVRRVGSLLRALMPERDDGLCVESSWVRTSDA